MNDDAYIGRRSENNIKCIVHDDLGWKNQTTRYILPHPWIYEWFSQFHRCGTYSFLSRSCSIFSGLSGNRHCKTTEKSYWKIKRNRWSLRRRLLTCLKRLSWMMRTSGNDHRLNAFTVSCWYFRQWGHSHASSAPSCTQQLTTGITLSRAHTSICNTDWPYLLL